MTWYIYLILLPLALGCASRLLASTTCCTTYEEQMLFRWHTVCADADLHRADAPEDPSVGGPLSGTRERPVEPRPYAKDERLTIIAVEPPDVVVEGMNGARHRARCVLTDESKCAAPLQPGDMLIVRSMNSGLAVVERVTVGRPDGGWYVLLEFRLISHQA
jgi:hypothetical protein